MRASARFSTSTAILGLSALTWASACSGGSSGTPIARSCAVSPSPAWKPRVAFPEEPFRVADLDGSLPSWIKFSVLACEPEAVHFQDGNLYAFHLEFATSELDPFIGLSREAFDALSLYTAGREVVLGAVLLPPNSAQANHYHEYGIQLVGRDPIPIEEVAALFHSVADRVDADPDVRPLYFPTYEQKQTALENAGFLAAEGIEIASPERWSRSDVVYSEGWTIGTLKLVPAGDIDDAFVAGELRTQDVLLTDGVPSDVPFVAGIVSLSPSSPNSHVAILSSTFDAPFAFLALEEQRERALELVGRRIALRARHRAGFDEVCLIDVEDELDPATIEEILALKNPAPLEIAALEPLGAYAASTAGLGRDDVRFFGGKAAHFGLLRRAIPDHAPVAAAFSFDLWTEFLEQPLSGGGTLRDAIGARLAPHAFPPDIADLEDDLEAVRDLIEGTGETSFSPQATEAVLATLADTRFGFDPFARIRFRSSTNVEDSERFSGAGLYESKSGCLADELDGDQAGPSSCDPEKPDERGVFRAIRKVFASFYGRNAFLERLRHGIDEHDVGMALLVHHSFLDEIELANGVATLKRGPHGPTELLLVTQLGAESVTNPSPGSVPEEVSVIQLEGFGPILSVERESNLVLLGSTVLEWEAEYRQLVDLLLRVSDRFALESGETEYSLDFEYKLIAPGRQLVIKQVRQVPRPENTQSVTPFLINQPVELVTFQGDFSNAFANHRLKVSWTLETRSMWLTPENLAEGIYSHATLRYHDGCAERVLSGDPSTWPGATHTWEDGDLIQAFELEDLANPRTFRLRTSGIPHLVAPSEPPIFIPGELGGGPGGAGARVLEVAYTDAVPTLDPGNGPFVFGEHVWLHPRPSTGAVPLPQERRIEGPGGITVTVRFDWPQPPSGIVAGYTAPLLRFRETVIENLTTLPIVLTHELAQTYRPAHHNFGEDFLFVPRLDPGTTEDQLAELEAAQVHWIQAAASPFGPTQQRIVLHSREEAVEGCSPPRTRSR